MLEMYCDLHFAKSSCLTAEQLLFEFDKILPDDTYTMYIHVLQSWSKVFQKVCYK